MMHGPRDPGSPITNLKHITRRALGSADTQELSQFEVFGGVDPELVADLLGQCTTEIFQPGSVIIEQDRPLEAFMIITRGLVDLTRIEGQREFGVLLLASRLVLLPRFDTALRHRVRTHARQIPAALLLKTIAFRMPGTHHSFSVASPKANDPASIARVDCPKSRRLKPRSPKRSGMSIE